MQRIVGERAQAVQYFACILESCSTVPDKASHIIIFIIEIEVLALKRLGRFASLANYK